MLDKHFDILRKAFIEAMYFADGALKAGLHRRACGCAALNKDNRHLAGNDAARF